MKEKSKMLRRCWVQHIGIQIDFTVCELKMFDNIRRDQSNCSKEGFLSSKRPQEADCQKGCVFLQSCSMHFDIYYNVNKKHENASCKYPHAFRGKHIVFGFKPTAQGQTAVQTDTLLSDISCHNGTLEQRHLLRKNLWDSLFPMSDRNWLGISTWHDVNAEYWSCELEHTQHPQRAFSQFEML